MGLFDDIGSGDIVTKEQIAMENEIEDSTVTMAQALMILRAKEDAVLAERRRCAAIARAYADRNDYAYNPGHMTADAIAEEIERG